MHATITLDGVLWNTFKRLLAGFREGEKTVMFHDTAARVYWIDV